MSHAARLFALLLLFSILTACGQTARETSALPTAASARESVSPGPNGSQSAWPSELFFVRPEGARGPLVAYDMADGRERFTLPAGMLSADEQHYFAAQADSQTTLLSAYDLQTGKPIQQFELSGPWALSGVSPTGRWLALTRISNADEKQAWAKAERWKTDVQIVDGQIGQTAHLLSLEGNFEVEALSGKSLFLVQHLPAVNPDHYVIRLYDLSAEKLIADPLRSKGSDEVMAGLAWEGVASPDGLWLLTLYLSTQRNVAFVHTLDLPSGNGDFNQLKDYSLVLSPNSQKVYAANATLGVVAEVDLPTRQLVYRTTFTPLGASTNDPHIQTARSVLAADGKTVYFTNGWEVWAYDTVHREVKATYPASSQVIGLGVSRDGQRLYIASLNQSLSVFEASSGRQLSFQPETIAGNE